MAKTIANQTQLDNPCQGCGACVEKEAKERYFESFKFQPDGHARGRNGVFVPDQAEVSANKGFQTMVSIWSRRTDGNPPIRFELTPADARKLAEHLLAAAKVAEGV